MKQSVPADTHSVPADTLNRAFSRMTVRIYHTYPYFLYNMNVTTASKLTYLHTYIFTITHFLCGKIIHKLIFKFLWFFCVITYVWSYISYLFLNTNFLKLMMKLKIILYRSMNSWRWFKYIDQKIIREIKYSLKWFSQIVLNIQI